MQIIKFSYIFVFLLCCISLLSCTPKNAESAGSEENPSQSTETTPLENTESTENKEANYTYSYKLGTDPKVEGKEEKLSVSLSKKGVGKKGQETYHTKLGFKIIYQNRISLSFNILDKSVVEKMNGQYPFTKYINFTSGEEQDFMTVMIVDAEGKNPPFASNQTSTAEVNFDGTNLKISIKGATVSSMEDSEVTVPFEFELDAKNVEVTKKGF